MLNEIFGVVTVIVRRAVISIQFYRSNVGVSAEGKGLNDKLKFCDGSVSVAVRLRACHHATSDRQKTSPTRSPPPKPGSLVQS